MIPDTRNILRTYLRRLTNLGGNNRSLLLLRLHSEQLIDLHAFSFLDSDKSFEIIRALIAEKSKKLCAVHDSRMEAVNQASTKLKKLQRLDKFIFEERGSNDLHVGWPMVHGKFSDGTVVRCPLLYFPVTLIEENNQWILQPREDAGITLNKSFLLAHSFYTQTPFDNDLPETTFDDFDRDSTVFRTQLYQLLKDSIELNFNPDTFTDQLIPFQEFKKDDFEKTHRDGELKLFQEAVLGIFPQAGSQLVPDYLKLIENESFADLEDFFAQRLTDTAKPIDQWVSSVKEEKIHTPFPQDAYQEHTLRVVKDGRSVVVQGPPGTGKSQLIANLIADGIASGKKILMVCQKRVALDVVYDRLKKTGLEDFIGLIHDFRNDRKAVYEKIARQIDRIDVFKTQNRSVDTIQLDRKFLQVCHAIDQATEELEEFREALFNETECGLSIKELYLTSYPHEPTINIRQEYREFDFNNLQAFTAKLQSFTKYAALFQHPDYVLKKRKSFASFNLQDLRMFEQILIDIPVFQQRIQDEITALLPLVLNLLEYTALHQRKAEAEEMLTLLTDDVVFESFQRMVMERDAETSLLWLQNMERVCLNCFDEPGLESTVESDRLGEVQIALQKRMDSRKGLINRLRWEFSKHKFLLKRVLIGNQLKYNKQGLTILEHRLDNRLNLEHHLTALRKVEWLQADVPANRSAATFTTWFALKTKALKAKLLFSSLRELQGAMPVQKYTLTEFSHVVHSLFSVLDKIPPQQSAWEHYLLPYQLQQLIVKPDFQQALTKALRNDFDNLVEFDKLSEALQSHELTTIHKLFETTQTWDYNTLEPLFQNSIRLAWIEHIELKYSILGTVSSFKMDELEASLQQNIREKQTLSSDILLVRARERTYEDIEYNRLNNRVTYRDLYHQTTKKKKIWPVRKVIAEFSNELFKLVPCWMASPEAVSAIFPMEQLFDLVIFDEASQCFAERGIPAMYRGKQVVVAGDTKQLKPFELYQVRWAEEETAQPDLEISSLLELSGRYLPTVQLQGHYRSKSLALIEFSNQHFYDNRLKLLPDSQTIRTGEVPIRFFNVEGTWTLQTNVAEAVAVADHALHLIHKFPEKEIGIITFNALQQMMILDLLEEKADRDNIMLPQSLFVKNIENVQGDEKDIIIFSIGYAPDENGKINLHFGSLNVAGGENRLNVAVTRAREKIIVFSSINPEDLKLQGIKNDGPKLLKKYLEYARAISEGDTVIKPQDQPQHASDWYLRDHLIEHGKAHYSNVSFSANMLPFTDVVLTDDELAAVLLTDDEVYKNSLTVKEAHAYTPALLEQKHWKYHRVFSRNWWINTPKAAESMIKFIYQLTEQ